MSGTQDQIAFTMQLDPSKIAEYQKRHDEIWPELVEVLRDARISDYSIFVEQGTGKLFAVLKLGKDHKMGGLSDLEIVRKWWDSMADIMATNDDNSPVVGELDRVFHMA